MTVLLTFKKSFIWDFVGMSQTERIESQVRIFRRRTKVAIGTHDLDVIAGPLTYEALNPKDIVFAPLNEKDVMNGHQIMKFYEQDRRLSKYLPIIRDSPIYPVVLDSKKRVLSLPPIINSDYSKISVNTKNIFIECTATDEAKAQTALNMIVGIFSQYCSDKFTYVMFSMQKIDVGVQGRAG